MDLSTIVDKFQLSVIDDSWTENVWRKDFCNKEPFPSEYEVLLEELNICNLFCTLSIYIKAWLEDTEDMDENISSDSISRRKSWQTLSSENVDHKKLLAVVSNFLKEDLKELKTKEDIIVAFEASRLYFMMLSIPGAHIFNLFNSVLFCQAIDTLKILKTVFRESVGNTATKKGKSKKNDKDTNCNGLTEENNENEEETQLVYTKGEQVKLIKLVSTLLNDLKFCLKSIDLKNEDVVQGQTIQNLVYVATLDNSAANILNVEPDRNSLGCLSHNAFKILEELCEPSFGNVEDVVRFTVSAIFPFLCTNEQDFLSSTSVLRSLNTLRDNLVTFLIRLITKVGEAAYQDITFIVQQLCIRTPDKADVRTRCANLIVSILENLPTALFNRLLLWLLSLCHTEVEKSRVVAVEILFSLLNSAHQNLHLYMSSNLRRSTRASTRNSIHSTPKARVRSNSSVGTTNTSSSSDCGLSTPITLRLIVSAIISRCVDTAPAVRAKALTSFSSIIQQKIPIIESIILETFVNAYLEFENIEEKIEEEVNLFQFKKFFSSLNPEAPTNGGGILNLLEDPMPGGIVIMKLMEKLTQDDKVFVKKAALSVVCNICLLNQKWITSERIKLIVQACKDQSVMIRKQMISFLTDLVRSSPMKDELTSAWVDGIFPLISDNELKSQEKVFEATTSLIIDEMLYFNKSPSPLSLLPWKILSLICSKGKRKLFRIVCNHWALNNKIRPPELKIIKSHLGTENNLNALFLLVCVSEFQNLTVHKILLQDVYNKVFGDVDVSEYESQLILEGIFLNMGEIDDSEKEKLCTTLKESIESFSVPLPLIARCLDIYQNTYPDEIKSFSDNLIMEAETYLKKLIRFDHSSLINKQHLCRVIYTLGEVIMTASVSVNEEIVTTFAAIIVPSNSDEIYDKWKDKISEQARCVIVVTLGKLCLRDQNFAKTIVPFIAGLLDSRVQSLIKINAMVTLTDLCVRYTSLVESFLGDMFICLRDQKFSVRKVALTLLMQLIKEDYIKLRSPFIFYLLCMLEDNSEEIREETTSFLISCTKSKQGRLMSSFLTQSLFFFNEYEYQNQYTENYQGLKVREAFSISGDNNREVRRRLYRFMLEQMQDDYKFKVMHKLVTDILAHAAQGTIELENRNGTLLVEDALYCLACDDIKLVHLNKAKDLGDDGSGEDKTAAIINNMIKRSVIIKYMREELIENTIPIMLNLKTKLVELKSPLLRDLRIALRELVKDFKDELNELLKCDKETAAEIALELRKIEMDEQDQLSPTTSKQYDKHVVMLKKIFVQCERLSLEALKESGYELPLQINQQQEVQESYRPAENEPTDNINGKTPKRKSVTRNSPKECDKHTKRLNSSRLKSPSQTAEDSSSSDNSKVDNTSEMCNSHIKELSGNKSMSSSSYVARSNLDNRNSCRASHSSLSTAYSSDSSQSTIINCMARDSNNICGKKSVNRKRRSNELNNDLSDVTDKSDSNSPSSNSPPTTSQLDTSNSSIKSSKTNPKGKKKRKIDR